MGFRIPRTFATSETSCNFLFKNPTCYEIINSSSKIRESWKAEIK